MIHSHSCCPTGPLRKEEGEVPYLIDGHNLIAAMPGLSLADLDDELALIRWLASFARETRKTITVYFDRGSLAAPQLPSTSRVKVNFTRPPRTADDAIRDHLQRLGKEASNWTVVSSDREVQAAARRSGAGVIDSRGFASLVSEQRDEETVGEKPEVSLGPDEIEAWEKLFRNEDRET